MEITFIPGEQKITLGQLDCGDVFRIPCESVVYMVLEECCGLGDENLDCNYVYAVNLSDGTIERFATDIEVEEMKTELLVYTK